jgi:hypothetical protein
MLVLQFLLPSTNHHVGSTNQQSATSNHTKHPVPQQERASSSTTTIPRTSISSRHVPSHRWFPAAEEAPPAVNNMEAEELPAPANMMMPRSTIARDGTQTFIII